MFIKILIVAALLLIVGTLFSALFMLFRGSDDPAKRLNVVRALTLRVSMSMALVLLIGLGIYIGWI